MNKSEAQNKAIHSKAKEKQTEVPKESLNAWGQDDKTAKYVRKHFRQEKKMKSFQKGAESRFKAGY